MGERRWFHVPVCCALLWVGAAAEAAEPNWPELPLTRHADYQAVDENGDGTFPWSTSGPVRMRGVLLNNPEDMLNTAAGAPGFMGGQWQVFFQATEVGDCGGTALWMGQYIGRVGSGNSYTDAQWQAELDRLNFDPVSGHQIRAGDLIEVRARAPGLFRFGKTNINEQHSEDPAADFDVRLVQAGYGLPSPALVALADLKDDSDAFIFQQDRLSGVEQYQGTLVRLNDVHLTSTTGWGPGASLTVTDASGRTMPILLGLGQGFSQFAAPLGAGEDGLIDVIGILDQEDSNGDDGWRGGYRLWVMDYNGNGHVLPEPACAGLLAIGGLVMLQSAGRRKRT